MNLQDLFENQNCPHCGGPAFTSLLLAEKKDACYNKVRSRYKVWPSAYASGALVQCRKKGAANWGNKSKNEDVAEGDVVPFRKPQPQPLTWQKLPRDVLSLANDWFWTDYEGGGLQATMDPKGLGSGIANQQKYLGAQLQQRGWAIDFDDEFENVVLKNRQGQTILLPIEDAQDFTGWAQGTNPVSEQGMSEGDKLPGTPVVSLSDFSDKDNTKDRYGRTVPKKLKKDDPRVKFHKDYSQHEKKLISKMSNAEKADKGWRNPNIDEGMAEGSGNIGAGIKSLFQKIYDQGDDEIEYFYYESPVFAQYWDQYEGDIDSIIAEVDPAELQIIHDELEAYAEGAGLTEVSDATLTSYLTKVDADARKHRADPTKRSPEKASRSVAGFTRAFNKLDARKEKVDEGSKSKK